MFLKTITVIAVGLASLACIQDEEKLEGVKCIVNGERAANMEHSAKHLDGDVYFCCGGCKAKFLADQKLEEPTMTVKANHQLVLSGQYVQKGCPMSGGALKEGAVTNVGGAEVGFCCEGCLGKVANTEGVAAKAEIVFSAKAFKNGFAKKVDLSNAKCPISGGAVNAEQFASHQGGNVYFCCEHCKAKFEESSEKFVTKANHQLALTGQVSQTGCPFSGGDVNEDHVAKVGGVSVGFCCGNCAKKVNDADTEEAKAALVFSAGAFEKGFGK